MPFLQEESNHISGPVNYYAEAFLVQYNWIGLVGAAAFSLVVLNPFPLLAALGLELMYLSVVPSNPRFQRWVRARRSVVQRRQKELESVALLEQMPTPVRKRYSELEYMCVGIRSNYNHLSSTSQVLLEQVQQSLASLLQTYLRLISAADQHHAYLNEASPQAIHQEIERLAGSIQPEATELQEVNRRRLEILRERLLKSEKILQNTKVLDAQCAAIEDMIELTRDQSLTLRDPQEISDQLDSLREDARRTEEAVKNVESFLAVES